MIEEGLRGPIGHIKLVPGPYSRVMNLWLPDHVIERIRELAARQSQRIGIQVDQGAIARWLMTRGLERTAQPDPMRKVG